MIRPTNVDESLTFVGRIMLSRSSSSTSTSSGGAGGPHRDEGVLDECTQDEQVLTGTRECWTRADVGRIFMQVLNINLDEQVLTGTRECWTRANKFRADFVGGKLRVS